MIPVRLQLKNFMCYRNPSPLDLTGIHLACLAGDNGHGKSALLDAMTWALWGKARARVEDELVFIGQTDMEVDLEFLLGDAHYRVIRKRELGHRSRAALELQIKSNGDFRSFTAATQRDTQARLEEILRMDYDTFINSALLLQGRADEFTVKAPAERKRVLADILGLSIYDEYEQRAKELVTEKEQAEREVQARIQEIDRELEHRPEYEKELEDAKAELVEASELAKVAEEALQDLRDRRKMLEGKADELAKVSKRIRDAEQELQELAQQLEAQAQRAASYESTLARRQEIIAGHARLLQAREKDAELNNKLAQLMKLKDQAGQIEKAIAEARKDLELKAHSAAERVLDLEKQVQRCAQWESEHARVSEELGQLTALQAKAEEERRSIAELSIEDFTLTALNEQLKLQMQALKDKTKLLQQPTAVCPLCGQDLCEGDRQRLLEQLNKDGRQQGGQYRGNLARTKEIAAEMAALESQVGDMERELRRLPALQGREAHLREALQEAEGLAPDLDEQRKQLGSLRQALAGGDFAKEDQQRLAAMATRIAQLGYDQVVHDEVRSAMDELKGFEADKAHLDQAEQSLVELRSSQEQLLKAKEQRAAALASDQEHEAELRAALAGFEELARDLEAKQQEADDLRSREGHARQAVGAAQQKLDSCRYWARERQDRVAQQKTLAEERGLYEDLRMAFGKRGLQALIIESAIPEVEDDANELLGRMTDGRMTLHFETQRDTKAGSTIETLDIKISDEYGSRSYEMYSGGEAFRINFAIRIALSKMLARRAGARLQTLIIDEGFGTQDADGRQKLVEAINAIKNDFALILVITHIEELKDAFPVRIDVYKTAAGSQLSIS